MSSWARGTSPPSFAAAAQQEPPPPLPENPTLTAVPVTHHTYHRRSYLVLEILLPLLLFSLLASSLLGPLFRLIGRTLRLGLGIAIRAVDFIAAKVLDPILEKILP